MAESYNSLEEITQWKTWLLVLAALSKEFQHFWPKEIAKLLISLTRLLKSQLLKLIFLTLRLLKLNHLLRGDGAGPFSRNCRRGFLADYISYGEFVIQNEEF
ncbi:hypothetical protein BTJ40_04925 [Microbulbifer sp. A4B17]|nr:hypothetical protein BTJ40_04925 [Microbulbifer sp. A4B17]